MLLPVQVAGHRTLLASTQAKAADEMNTWTKLDLRDRVQIVVWSFRHGIVSPADVAP